MSDTDRYCQDCETSFDTLTELRLHDCDDFRADESTEELESEFGESETYEFHGEVDTWSGTVEATSTGPIIDQASGRDCALCGDDAAVLMDPTIEWKRILREEHDGYNPVSSHQQIPLCPPCDVRLDA